jgi:hypothetical protein
MIDTSKRENANMSYASNDPLMDDPKFSAPQGAIPVWTKVFTKPGEQTFLEITQHRDATAKSAYIWVFIAGTISGLINSLLNFVVSFAGLQQAFASEAGSQLPINPGIVGMGGLLGAICSAPLTGLMSVLGFIIGTGIIHATARFFGGQGSFDKLAYAIGAITVPVTVISALMVPLNAIPFVAFCTIPVLLGLSLYVLYLEVAAIKAIHRLGWGESAGALLLPGILLTLLCGVCLLLGMRAMGPELNEIFQQLQQLQP